MRLSPAMTKAVLALAGENPGTPARKKTPAVLPPLFEGCGHRAEKVRQFELWKMNLNGWLHGDVIADCAYRLHGEAPHEEAPVHLYYRAGFPAEVRAPLTWHLGGACECGGWPDTPAQRRLIGPAPTPTGEDGWCAVCKGTGRTPGRLPGLGKVWPVTACVVTDREPWHHRRMKSSEYFWFDDDYYGKPSSVLPPEVFTAVLRMMGIDSGPSRIEFPTRDAALAALSAAVLQLAKERSE